MSSVFLRVAVAATSGAFPPQNRVVHANAPYGYQQGKNAPILPVLREHEQRRLAAGKRVQFQDFDGKQGSGYAVQDIKADANAVWRCVSDFERYDSLIGTVREAAEYEPERPVDGTSCYSFLVSRIRLKLNVRFCVSDEERFAYWTLERPSWVLNDSDGFWHVQALEGEQGMVRVWFCVGVVLSPLVPGFVVNLVSRVGLTKAFSWVSKMDEKKKKKSLGVR